MRIFVTAALAAIFTFLAPVELSAQSPLPISEYGKLPDVETVTLSPSGRRIALLTTIDGERVLMAIEDQEKLIRMIKVNDLKIRDLEWIGEDRLLLVSSQTEDLGYGFTTDKAEFAIGRVLPIDTNSEGGIVFGNNRALIDSIRGNYGIRQIDGRYYGFYGAIRLVKETGSRLGYKFDHGRPHLYRVDLQDMSTKLINSASAAGIDRDWLIDANGEVAATLDVNENSGNWKLRNSQNNTVAEGKNPFAAVWLVGLNFDGSSAIVGERTAEEVTWSLVPLAGGERTPFLDDIDIDRAYFNDATGHMIGYLEGGSDERVTFSNADHEKIVRKVRKAFPDLRMRMVDWTGDLQSVVVRTSGNKDSGTYYAVDLQTSRANAIAYAHNAIGPEHVGAVSMFEYTARDGMEMDGVLTLPPGRKAKNLPLVMLPHGGPHSHDSVRFDWWAQAFASRGYAVFQPNFRGSTNKGSSFRTAGYGEWGRKMQTDKSDGLAALANAGIVDPKRVCIVGASYGGYAALAGVTIQQDIYRCAVAVAPVSDIKDMYNEDYRATGKDRTTKASLLEQLGPRNGWDAVSPLRLASQASAPIMLIHGKDDTVVPYSHSSKMADKLKDANKPYEMVTLDGEDHWLSLSTTRQLMLEKAVGFVERYNPAD